MRRCIYCKKPNDAKGLAHVLPEAVFANPAMLPRGDVCDPCNSYFGRNIDVMLRHWPGVALHVQFYGLPGKKGRPRAEIGDYRLTQRDDGSNELSFAVEEALVEELPNGKRQVTVPAPRDAQFSMPYFRRSLHYVALNWLALSRGADHALESRYDNVREYVRRGRGEWPFAVVQIGNDRLRSFAEVHRLPLLGEEAVAIQLFRDMFIVDLCPDGTFSECAQSSGFELYPPGLDTAPDASLRYVEL